MALFAGILKPMQQEIYFHTGLGKVASTYLQYKVFPKLKGIDYIQRTRYKKAFLIIEKTSAPRILLSREFDRQFERELSKFSEKFPEATIIILLRRHDSWIASQYRRYVKNGGAASFEKFIDLESDQGLWKQADLCFYPKIQFVLDHFNKPPLVFFYEDIRNDFFAFLNDFCTKTQTSFDRNSISIRPFHTSYNEKQLKIIRACAGRLFKQNHSDANNKIIKWLQHKSRMLPRYFILYLSLLVPNVFVSKKPLIDENYLMQIRNYFEEDWQKCLDKVSKLNQTNGK